MDLGLDEYSSDTDSCSELKATSSTTSNNNTNNNTTNTISHYSTNNNDDDDDDIPIFEIKTKSTRPKVQLDEQPKSLLNTFINTTTTTTTTTNNNNNNNNNIHHDNGYDHNQQPIGLVETCILDGAEFDQLYHQSKKQTAKALAEQNAKRAEYQKMRQLAQQSLDNMTKEERDYAAISGFHSDYSDDDNNNNNNNNHNNKNKDNRNTRNNNNNNIGYMNENSENKNQKRRHVNLDATSDDYTGSWGLDEGEKEEKERVRQLNISKKQRLNQELVDEYGNEMTENEHRRQLKETEQRKTREKSIYYGKVCEGEYKTTYSSSESFISFDYNTPYYLHTIVPYRDEYKGNKIMNKDEVEKQQYQDDLNAKIKRKDDTTTTTTTGNKIRKCYDSYHDIKGATMFKHERNHVKKYDNNNNTNNNDDTTTPTNESINTNNINNFQPDPTISKLYSFIEPPHGRKIHYHPALLLGINLNIQKPNPSKDKCFQYRPVPATSNITNNTNIITDYNNNNNNNNNQPLSILPPTAQNNTVSMIKFIPWTGSHIAAGYQDGSIRLYSTNSTLLNDTHRSNHGCIRSYHGHTRGLTDFQWVDNGRRCFTSSYDGWMKLWDVETGKVLFRENTTIGPFMANATPLRTLINNKNNANVGTSNSSSDGVTVGLGNGQIKTYDFRTNSITMQYAQMQSAITTMVDIPTGSTNNNGSQMMMCASADGQIFVYELGIPSTLQHVMQHGRQMITRACIHPSEQFIIANTQSNSACIFKIEQNGKIKLNKNKTFVGHETAGFTPGIVSSPDGKYILSGDGKGRVMCWEFKTGKVIAQEKIFTNVTSDVDWAWNHSSMYAVGSWDGNIRIYGNTID